MTEKRDREKGECQAFGRGNEGCDPHLLAGSQESRGLRESGRARVKVSGGSGAGSPKPLTPCSHPTFPVTSWSCSSQRSQGLVPWIEAPHPFPRKEEGPDSLHGLDFCVHPGVRWGGGMRGG